MTCTLVIRFDESHKNNKPWDILLSWFGRFPMGTNCSHWLWLLMTRPRHLNVKLLSITPCSMHFQNDLINSNWYWYSSKREAQAMDSILLCEPFWTKSQQISSVSQNARYEFKFLFSAFRRIFHPQNNSILKKFVYFVEKNAPQETWGSFLVKSDQYRLNCGTCTPTDI